jgi:hydroxymethylpyrimidine pyrophosphatase-like HAD family hydrolase
MSEDKWIIFDLDGTLALIDERRKVSEKENGKLDWDKFFDPENIKLDEPNKPVIMMAQALKAFGYKIAILSGRSKATKEETKNWLKKYDIDYNILKMRPTNHPWKFMDDRKLKKYWLDDLFEDRDKLVAVFDDRQKVVDMWREEGLTCMQVDPGEWPPKNVL